MEEQHDKALKAASHHGVPTSLFPLEAPWSLFPWYEQLGPRADCEESLRLAIGLRDLHRLSTYLAQGVERGLTKRNSHIFYAATELNELLIAEGSAQARSAAVGLNDDVPPADDAAASAGGGTPPLPLPLPPRREKTEAVRLRLNDALSAFIEEVCYLVITPALRLRRGCRHAHPTPILTVALLTMTLLILTLALLSHPRWTRVSSTTPRCSSP